jgi:hypothetical protein
VSCKGRVQAVQAIQAALVHLWDHPASVDGVLGPQTQEAWADVLIENLHAPGLSEDAWDDEVQVER